MVLLRNSLFNYVRCTFATAQLLRLALSVVTQNHYLMLQFYSNIEDDNCYTCRSQGSYQPTKLQTTRYVCFGE